MRRVLVDYARRYRAQKRGGDRRAVSLDEASLPAAERADTVLALDEALVRLADLDARLSQVVECRFFGGYSEEETAEVVGVDARTVRRRLGQGQEVALARALGLSRVGGGVPREALNR